MTLTNNKRISITIDPWAVSGTDGSEMTDSYTGMWTTPLTPMYSHLHLVQALGGKVIESMPAMLVNVAIYEASRYVDNVAVLTCNNPDTEYFCAIRNRYVTLRALLSLFDGYLGPALVKRKVLGDFEIEFDYRNTDSSVMSKYLNELEKLEPAVMNKGCLGVGADHGMIGVTKGAYDPYRPIIARTHEIPDNGAPSPIYGYYSPGYEPLSSRFANRWNQAGVRRFPRKR